MIPGCLQLSKIWKFINYGKVRKTSGNLDWDQGIFNTACSNQEPCCNPGAMISSMCSTYLTKFLALLAIPIILKLDLTFV